MTIEPNMFVFEREYPVYMILVYFYKKTMLGTEYYRVDPGISRPSNIEYRTGNLETAQRPLVIPRGVPMTL